MATAAEHQIRILVQAAAQACEDKKAEDTRILELDAVDAALADFFLVTSATNDRQCVAIADEIEIRLKKQFGVYPNSVEGRRQGEWILLDYVDFVVHVFLSERRAFYDIERLRKSARPLTPAEFDAELKTALAERTRAARKKAPVKAAAEKTISKTANSEANATPPKSRATAQKAKTPAKKPSLRTIVKKAAVKKVPAKKSIVKTSKSK